MRPVYPTKTFPNHYSIVTVSVLWSGVYLKDTAGQICWSRTCFIQGERRAHIVYFGLKCKGEKSATFLLEIFKKQPHKLHKICQIHLHFLQHCTTVHPWIWGFSRWLRSQGLFMSPWRLNGSHVLVQRNISRARGPTKWISPLGWKPDPAIRINRCSNQ